MADEEYWIGLTGLSAGTDLLGAVEFDEDGGTGDRARVCVNADIPGAKQSSSFSGLAVCPCDGFAVGGVVAKAAVQEADESVAQGRGHLDVCVMGAFQVSDHGDLANWSTGAVDAIPAVGGAMDLAIGAKAVFVMMSLFAKDGAAKLVRE